MKISTKKSSIGRNAAKKPAKPSKATKSAVSKVRLAKDDRTSEPKKFTVAKILDRFHSEGVDGSPIWMGENIDQGAAHRLFTKREEIAAHKVKAVHGQFLTVLGRQLYIWPLTGLDGDIYERQHSPKLRVKGSINYVKSIFGAKNVKVLSKQEAQDLTKKFRTDKESREAVFGSGK